MRVLDRKVFRDLWAMKSQVLAIGLVIAGGVATYVMSLSTMDSLQTTQAAFYREASFAHVFASLKRAPEALADRLRAIPGVRTLETRVVAEVKLELDGYPNPVTGRLVSLPDDGQPSLNRLHFREGRRPVGDREVVVSEAFARSHGFRPGNGLGAVINGRHRRLTIVGVALSPEYIFQFKPGSIFPDFERYGVLWMARTGLAAAYNMEGAFNDVTLGIESGVHPKDVIERLDLALRPYGGLGAYDRTDQISHRYLSEEFKQLGQMAFLFPVIFMGVAVFLLNVVVSRLVATQRELAATLKAFGYRDRDIGLHYLKLILAVVVLGGLGGILAGVWMGQGLSRMYMVFYRFPYLHYLLDPKVPGTAIVLSAGAAVIGTLGAVYRAARRPPAEAMRPEPPAVYRPALAERLGLSRRLSQPTRMILRGLERKPIRSLLAVLGIALALAIVVTGGFFEDATEYLLYVQFQLTQREDLTVTFTDPVSRSALAELVHLPGVRYGEPFRAVPVQLTFGRRRWKTSVLGLEPGNRLHRLLDDKLASFDLPPEGLILTDYLGRRLGLGPGDMVTVEVLEGRRPVRNVPVAGLVRQMVGVAGYMDLAALNRMMGEGPVISGAYLAADADQRPRLYRTLHERPRVAGIEVQAEAIKSFMETMSRQTLIFTAIITILASIIAFGVVYNSARIALAERNRELASLRVLGFTRAEIAYILVGELALITLAALGPGMLMGRFLCAYMVAGFENELFRVPLIIAPWTYSFAAAVVIGSALFSALVLKRKLDRLDLVEALKTRE